MYKGKIKNVEAEILSIKLVGAEGEIERKQEDCRMNKESLDELDKIVMELYCRENSNNCAELPNDSWADLYDRGIELFEMIKRLQ